LPNFSLKGSLADISEEFNKKGQQRNPFEDAGLLVGRNVFTLKTLPAYDGPRQYLGDVLQPEHAVPEEFYVSEKDLPKWRYLKGAKSELRKKPNGVEYSYDEGPIAFPDPLDRPSRTIITAEGGSTPSRFKHIIQLPDGRWRRLTPVELEKLSGFPEDHTRRIGITDAKRAFFMGNALVTGIVTRIGLELASRLK
jgi:DNA (cytosine-5)-methyltransferase 1